MSITTDRKMAFGVLAIILSLLAIIGVKLLPKREFTRIPNEDDDFDDDDEQEKKQEQDVVQSDQVKYHEIEKGLLQNSSSKATRSNDDGTGSIEMIQKPDANYLENDQNQSSTGEEEKGLMALIMTREYYFLLIWFSVQVVPLQFYIATIGFQLERMGDTNIYTSLFSILYASSAVFSPIIGKLADAFGLGIAQGLATILSSLSFFILSLEEVIPLGGHVVGMVCYGIGRMIVFGCFFTNIGKRFGYQHYGTMAGLGLMVSALFSLLQYPLIAASAAGNVRAVNIACGSVLLFQGMPYCHWLMHRERNSKK